MKNILLPLVFCLICGSIFAQKAVYPLPLDSNSKVKLSGNHFCYALPTTAIRVDVTIVKVREIKGYYSDYAEKMLGLTNIISDNRTFHKVKEVSISTREVSDDNMVFVVEPSSNQLKDPDFLNSLLTHRNLPDNSQFETTYNTQASPIPHFFQNYANVTYTETEDAFVETKIINGVVTQVPANRTHVVSKTANQKVQEAVDRITQIRKERNALIAGEQEVAYTKDALELMINKLDEAENDYLDLFRGISLEDEIHYTFYRVPESTDNSINIFSMDSENGFSLPANPNDNIYSLQFKAHDHQDLKPASTSNNTNNGYRYRRPQTVQISLILNGEKIHDFGLYLLDQWGVIETLPANTDCNINKIGMVN